MRGPTSGRFSRRGRDSHDRSNDPPNGPPRSRHCSEGLDERFSQGSVSSSSMGDAVSSPCQMHTSSEFIGTFIAQGRSAIQQNSHGRNALNSAPPFHLESLPYIWISPKLATSSQYSALINLLLLICLILSTINHLPSIPVLNHPHRT